MKTVAQILKHDFKSKGNLYLYDCNGNESYYERSDGYWWKREYDVNSNEIYYEILGKFWYKQEYDSNGKAKYSLLHNPSHPAVDVDNIANNSISVLF